MVTNIRVMTGSILLLWSSFGTFWKEMLGSYLINATVVLLYQTILSPIFLHWCWRWPPHFHWRISNQYLFLFFLYKLISTMLAARLGWVTNTVVATTQTTFIKGRNLVDGGMCGYWYGEENGPEMFSL